MAETEVVQLLARMFPSFRGIPPEEAMRRAESLGQFASKAWTAGAQAMQGRGIPVPPDAHARLAPVAAQAAQAGRGGIQFIAQLRQGLADDARFVQVMTGVARVFAEVTRGGAPQAAAPQAAPAPTIQPPAAAPARDFGDLELMPEEESTARSNAFDLVPEAPGTRAAAGLDLAPEEPSSGGPSAVEMLYGGPSGPDESGAPQDPAERAFFMFERTGEVSYLQRAQAALQGDLQKAPHATAAAIAEAGLAKVALLRGDGETAERLAKSALARDSSNPFAVEVMIRANRGEAARAVFQQGLRQLTAALDSREMQRIQQVGQGMAQRYPVEPFGHLALMFAAHMAENEAAFERYLKQAWTTYPSPDNADCTFGGQFDADLAEVLLFYGRKPYKKFDEEGLRKTVEDVDSKDNLIAGSLRMAVGIARVALTTPGIGRPLQRRLHFACGRGMMGLQYFQAAPDVMGRAMMIGPTPEEAKAISDERIKCQALWRAFDKPGIKAQGQKFQCLGARGMSETLRTRLEEIRADRQAREKSLYEKGPMLIQKAAVDPSIAAELAEAARVCGAVDPLAKIKEIDAEISEIESGGKKKEPKKASGGLFGKLKAAAVDAAKGVSDRIKIPQLKAKRDDAVKNLAVVIARDLSDHTFKHPLLIGFARQGAVLEAFVDYLTAEEKRCQKELTTLAGG